MRSPRWAPHVSHNIIQHACIPYEAYISVWGCLGVFGGVWEPSCDLTPSDSVPASDGPKTTSRAPNTSKPSQAPPKVCICTVQHPMRDVWCLGVQWGTLWHVRGSRAGPSGRIGGLDQIPEKQFSGHRSRKRNPKMKSDYIHRSGLPRALHFRSQIDFCTTLRCSSSKCAIWRTWARKG